MLRALAVLRQNMVYQDPSTSGTPRTPAIPSSGLCTHTYTFVHNLQIDAYNKNKNHLKNNSVSFYIVRHRK